MEAAICESFLYTRSELNAMDSNQIKFLFSLAVARSNKLKEETNRK